MSDIEEPPSKISKLEFSGTEEHLDPEGDEDMMEEGQEEWLSEGVLTDDDYNPGADQDTVNSSMIEMAESNQTMEEETANSIESSSEQLDHSEAHEWPRNNQNEQSKMHTGDQTIQEQVDKVNGKHQNGIVPNEVKKDDQNIEDTLNDLDRRNELPDDLDAFLIRKSDGQVLDKKSKMDENQKNAQAEDDGNDTDDLLRMLGEDDSKAKKKVLIKKTNSEKNDLLSSDDEFTYENAKLKTLKVAKSVLMKKRPATKAVPEDLSDGDTTDASSDEATTMKKIFSGPAKKAVASKSTAKSAINKPTNNIHKPTNPTTLKQYVNKNPHKPALKPFTPPVRTVAKPPEPKPIAAKPDLSKPKAEVGVKGPEMKPSGAKGGKVEVNKETKMQEAEEHDEIIDEEEFLEEDEDFDLDEEEFAEESEAEEEGQQQRIMRPERMDEEVPTDGESHTEDGSLYDEIPSSDSEDLDDWFSLDIRAERAGDYLPLLGSKARELLCEEKRRVSARLSTLRHSLAALTHSGRRQAEQLRRATTALAHLDDMLKAT